MRNGERIHLRNGGLRIPLSRNFNVGNNRHRKAGIISGHYHGAWHKLCFPLRLLGVKSRAEFSVLEHHNYLWSGPIHTFLKINLAWALTNELGSQRGIRLHVQDNQEQELAPEAVVYQ